MLVFLEKVAWLSLFLIICFIIAGITGYIEPDLCRCSAPTLVKHPVPVECPAPVECRKLEEKAPVKRRADDFMDKILIYGGKECWRSFAEYSEHVYLVCVGQTWFFHDYRIYSEYNSNPFNTPVEPLKVKILEIKDGWVKVERTGGLPENRNVKSLNISKELFVYFTKVEE